MFDGSSNLMKTRDCQKRVPSDSCASAESLAYWASQSPTPRPMQSPSPSPSPSRTSPPMQSPSPSPSPSRTPRPMQSPSPSPSPSRTPRPMPSPKPSRGRALLQGRCKALRLGPQMRQVETEFGRYSRVLQCVARGIAADCRRGRKSRRFGVVWPRRAIPQTRLMRSPHRRA